MSFALSDDTSHFGKIAAGAAGNLARIRQFLLVVHATIFGAGLINHARRGRAVLCKRRTGFVSLFNIVTAD